MFGYHKVSITFTFSGAENEKAKFATPDRKKQRPTLMARRQRRNYHMNTFGKACAQGIGNLTLVSQALNPSMSNSPWAGTVQKPGKRDALNKHAIMHMNRIPPVEAV